MVEPHLFPRQNAFEFFLLKNASNPVSSPPRLDPHNGLVGTRDVQTQQLGQQESDAKPQSRAKMLKLQITWILLDRITEFCKHILRVLVRSMQWN